MPKNTAINLRAIRDEEANKVYFAWLNLVWCFFLFLGRLCQIGFGDLLVRYVEGSVDKDAGAMIRDGIKVMEKMGVCPVTCPGGDDFLMGKRDKPPVPPKRAVKKVKHV